MSPNKQSRKQRTRGKSTTHHIARERTVLTLAEDSALPYMHPAQSAFPPGLGNMFAQFQPHGQQQPPGSSVPDLNSFQFQQQPGMMHPFNQLQSSTFFNQMQPFQQGQQSQGANSGEKVSDLEKLRQLKSTILAGQHPFFQPVPNPDALANIYLGPHTGSQAFQQQQNQPQQSNQLGNGPSSQPQPQSEHVNTPQKSEPPQGSAKAPLTPNSVSGLGPSKSSESFPALSSSVSVPSGVNHQPAPNGVNTSNNGRPRPNVTIPPKSVDYRTATASPQPLSGIKANVAHTQPQHGPPSGALGANHEQSRPISATTSPTSLREGVGANLSKEIKESSTHYKEAHPDAIPGMYERERDRERERSSYPVYDSPRYSQPPDRRDFGRFGPRYSDTRYDRDRDWDRGRDWERDRDRDREHEREREKERERDKDRHRVDDNPLDDRRAEYERSSRPPLDRQPLPTQSSGSVEQKPLASPEQRPPLGQSVEPRRSDVPPHPEQHRPAIPPDQSPRRTDATVARSAPPPPSPSADQRRPEASGTPFPPSNLPPHERERSRFGPATTPRPLPPQGHSPSHSHSQPQPQTSTPFRPEQRHASGSTPVDDRGGSSRPVPPDQRASSGGTVPRPSPPSPESNRRPESVSGRPPTSGSMPPPADTSASRAVPERRLTHPGDPPPPPRASVGSDSRTGHDDRDVSRPFYSHPPGQPLHRPASRSSSPAPRRSGDATYGDRDRAPPPSNYREPPSNVAAARGFAEDLRRQSLETNTSRRNSDYYPPTPPTAAPPPIDRQNEIRQWRERESYPPASYPDADAERERARRYPNGRWVDGRWVDVDPYGRERDGRGSDADVHPRGRPPPPPPPPASWDRERPGDKDKERERYEGWNAERKYSTSDTSAPPPSAPPIPPRWEDPGPPSHAHRPPLHARLTDTYDERFIPADRARYPPPPAAGEDVPMRDSFRENPRVRPRSPSPVGRPPFDDSHRAKRPREEYEPLTRPPYYEDARRPPRPPPDVGYFVTGRTPSPPPYFTPRAPDLPNPRDPSPYSRDRPPDVYPRRDMPPPRPPPSHVRDRYPPR